MDFGVERMWWWSLITFLHSWHLAGHIPCHWVRGWQYTVCHWASQSHNKCDEISVSLKCSEWSAWEQHKPSADLSSCFPLASQCWPTAVEMIFGAEGSGERGCAPSPCLCSSQRVGSTEREKPPREAATRNCLKKPTLKSGSLVNICFCYLEANDV